MSGKRKVVEKNIKHSAPEWDVLRLLHQIVFLLKHGEEERLWKEEIGQWEKNKFHKIYLLHRRRQQFFTHFRSFFRIRIFKWRLLTRWWSRRSCEHGKSRILLSCDANWNSILNMSNFLVTLHISSQLSWFVPRKRWSSKDWDKRGAKIPQIIAGV